MLFNFNTIPATINALTKLAQVLDQYRFGAVMLIVFTALMVIAFGLMTLS